MQAGRSKQTGSTAGNLPVTEHFPQGPPYQRIEPIQDTGKVHQTACQRVFICMVWRLRAVVFNRPLLASSVIPSYSIRIVISGFLPKRRHFSNPHPSLFLVAELQVLFNSHFVQSIPQIEIHSIFLRKLLFLQFFNREKHISLPGLWTGKLVNCPDQCNIIIRQILYYFWKIPPFSRST